MENKRQVSENDILKTTVENLAKDLTKKNRDWIDYFTPTANVLSAFAALLGAGYAIYLTFQTNEMQEKIEAKQEKLDKADIYTYENSRISRFGYTVGKFCVAIPLDDSTKWKTYLDCLKNKGVRDKIDFASDKERFECYRKIMPYTENRTWPDSVKGVFR